MRPEPYEPFGRDTPSDGRDEMAADAARGRPKRQAQGEDHPESFARQILLRRLTDRPRSRAELAEALAKGDVPGDVATAVLDRFEEVGLIDDEEFARTWVQSRQRSRGLAGRLLAQELRRKGIDDELIRDTVGEIDPESEEQAARRLVQKRLRSLRKVDDAKKTQRLVGMLARKGYSPGLAYKVVRDEIGADAEAFESL